MWHYIPVILVTGVQVAISVLARGRLDSYVKCLEESLQVSLNVSEVDLTDTMLPVSCLLCKVDQLTFAWISLLRLLVKTRKFMCSSSYFLHCTISFW